MHSTRLLDVPSDVIIQTLCLLQVKDVLSIERTCKGLRDIAATRHVWLTQLGELDRFCAPDLPPHIEVDSLSDTELRSLVVNAVRNYHNCLRGVARYVRKTTVVPGDSIGRFYSSEDENVRLAPGGRYLFIKDAYDTLQIHDLQHNNACVWSYKAQGHRRFREWSAYAFEICRDGSITLMLAVDEGNDKWSIEVHRLTPSDNDNEELQSQQVYFCKNEKQLGYARLEGDYVVVESEQDLIVVNWKDSWRVHITTYDRITDTKILHGLLFVCTHDVGFDENATFAVVHLDQLLSKFQVTVTDSIDVPKLNLEVVATSKLNFFVGPRASLQQAMAVYSRHRHRRSYSILLLGGQSSSGASGDLLCFELIYELDQPSGIPDQPSLSAIRHVENIPRNYPLAIEVLSCISKSGCGLLLGHGSVRSLASEPAGKRTFVKFGFDRDGSLFLAPLPRDFQIYIEDVKRPRNCFLEYYSGALVMSSDGESIDVWYPA